MKIAAMMSHEKIVYKLDALNPIVRVLKKKKKEIHTHLFVPGLNSTDFLQDSLGPRLASDCHNY